MLLTAFQTDKRHLTLYPQRKLVLYRVFNGKTYKRIACWREKYMAEGYAVTLRSQKTFYLDIKVEYSGGWWCVYGQE